MKKILTQFTAGALSACLAFCGVLPIFATETEEALETTQASQTTDGGETTDLAELADIPEEPTEYEYVISGLGTVTGAETESLGAAGTFYNFTCENGSLKQSVYTAVFDPSRGAVVRGEMLGSRFGGRAAVSSLKNEDEATELLAAVNADFFSLATGVPMGVFMQDGRFVSSSDGRAAIGFDKDGGAFIGTVGDSIKLTHSGDDYAISYLNKYPTVYGVYLLTRDFGENTYLSENVPSTEYIIELDEDIAFGERVRGEVTEIRSGVAKGEIPEGCAVLVVPDAYANRAAYEALEEGDRVYIEAECNELFEDAVNAIGGGDILLSDGVVQDNLNTEDIQKNRNPRTAVGITADGQIIFTVVDGRQTGYSSGLKMTELAEAMLALGAVDAINLDGGGSSTFVLFGEDGAQVVNSPSDKAERKVPNAIAAYADIDTVEKLHTLSASVEYTTVLSGASLEISLSVTDYNGEVTELSIDDTDIITDVDSEFGTVEFRDGRMYFVAGALDGFGPVYIEVEYEGETLSCLLFLEVTTTVDSLVCDSTVLLEPTYGEGVLNVQAFKGEDTVCIDGMLGVLCENERFVSEIDGGTVKISLPKAEGGEEIAETTDVAETAEVTEPVETTEAEETTEAAETTDISEPAEADEEPIPAVVPEPARGRVAIWLLDKTIVVPAYFDNELSLSLDSLLKDNLSLALDGHTVDYVEGGGVSGDGAFVISPVIPEPEVTETTEVGETAEAGETTEAAQTTEVVETTEVIETTEAVETTVATETAEVGETTDISGTTEVEEIEEPQEFTVRVDTSALVSDGLRARQLWLWADGLETSSNPHMIVTVTDSEGNVHEETIYYEMFYDFLAFNGRALLTLYIDSEVEGKISVISPLVYTATEPEQNVSFGPFVIGDEYDTNLYADTAEHWSSYYVNSLSYMGIVGGGNDNFGNLVFRPDDNLSREQFAKILVNFLCLDTEEYAESELTFADNDKIAEWAVPYVRAAVGAGLMRGRSTAAGTVEFAPADPITRQEAFYVLGGLLGEVEGEGAVFADSEKIAAWAAENMQKLFDAGILSGYSDGTVRPEGRVTRAEAATVVVKIADYSANS